MVQTVYVPNVGEVAAQGGTPSTDAQGRQSAPLSLVVSLTNPPILNVKDYGAKVDGVTDDSAAFTAAYLAASVNGGVVSFNGGTLVKGNDTLLPNVIVDANGGTIMLKPGANTDLFSGQTNLINTSAVLGTGVAGALYNFGFRNVTLDGNKANQSSGPSYPLRFYGYGGRFHNLTVRNGYSGGVLSDWNGTASSPGNDSMESQWSNIKVHDNNGIGFQMNGPHDSQISNLISFSNTGIQIHFCPCASGIQGTNMHSWGLSSGDPGWLIEAAGCHFNGCVAEAPGCPGLVILHNDTQWKGRIFSPASQASATGVQLGQTAGNTPYGGMIFQAAGVTLSNSVVNLNLDLTIYRCEGTHGSIWFANDQGKSIIIATMNQTAGSAITGNPNVTTALWITSTGLTADGTLNKSGGISIVSEAFNALRMTTGTQDVFNFNTRSKKLELVNGCYIHGYSDNYVTEKWSVNKDNLGSAILSGSLSLGQSATAAVIANAATVVTAGVSVARVAPTGNVTGIILAVGTVAGQVIMIVNESAFTVTMDVAGTSHVAQGVSMVIAALDKKILVWDSGTSLWY